MAANTFTVRDIHDFYPNILLEKEDGYWVNSCKKGNASWKRALFIPNEITWLNTCQLCGKSSTPKKVCRRNDVWGWNHTDRYDFSESKDMLCTGCWNKVRPVVTKEIESREIKRLLNKLNRERLKCQKSQTAAN